MRRGLFSEEEKASRRYVHNLEKAIALFDTSLSDYPIVISSTLSSCAQSVHDLKEKLRELSQAAEHTDPRQLSDIVAQFDSVKSNAGSLAGELSSLKSTVEHLRALAEGVPAGIKEQLVSAKVDIDEVRWDLRTKVASIQSDLTAIDKVLTDFVVVAQGRIEAIR
jgi:predicted  nucleic acid-binding Zn-ribbon protein